MTGPHSKPPILVSACLLGQRCRYNAVRRQNGQLLERDDVELVPVCPEILGGLPTPRPAASIQGGDGIQSPDAIQGGDGGDVLDGRARVVDETGRDVTTNFVDGAHAVLRQAKELGATHAILKSRSPSCGLRTLSCADGVRPGNGVCAELLQRHGLEVENAEFDDAR